MNAVKHCQISVKRWGGINSDYLEIHQFIDHTKSICADARHRILHTQWAVNHIVVPIFGDTLINSDGKSVDIKDMCERDHLLMDYQNKFIPTLSDFVEALSDNDINPHLGKQLDQFHNDYIHNDAISELMLTPLAYTGRLKSLLITHNSWFINTILPKIFHTKPLLTDFTIEPSMLFNAMNFELWMDNGITYPNSYKKLEQKLIQ
ncbi:MAG: hypothetical protein KAI02_06755 [Gammaproteobacteria bacterium]|nr:hypothetical protein [Gammaproteobacteria bacterium]